MLCIIGLIGCSLVFAKETPVSNAANIIVNGQRNGTKSQLSDLFSTQEDNVVEFNGKFYFFTREASFKQSVAKVSFASGLGRLRSCYGVKKAKLVPFSGDM